MQGLNYMMSLPNGNDISRQREVCFVMIYWEDTVDREIQVSSLEIVNSLTHGSKQ